jgi:uncharacterized membrane protein YqjE
MQQNSEVRSTGDPEDRRPAVSEIVERVVEDLQTIFHDEVRLASGELKEKARRSTRAALLLAGAGLLGLLAAECLITTFIAALSLVLPLWLAALLIGVVLAIGAGGAYLLGRLALEDIEPVPQKTVETLRDLSDWARARTR